LTLSYKAAFVRLSFLDYVTICYFNFSFSENIIDFPEIFSVECCNVWGTRIEITFFSISLAVIYTCLENDTALILLHGENERTYNIFKKSYQIIDQTDC